MGKDFLPSMYVELEQAIDIYCNQWVDIANRMERKGYKKTPNAWRKLYTRVSRDKISKENVSSFTINKDKISLSRGEISSDKIILIDREKLTDERELMLAHGFDPDKFELIRADSTMWDGQTKKSGKETFYSSKISVRKITGLSVDGIRKLYESLAGKAEPIPFPNPSDVKGRMLELTLADLHLNKLAWRGTVAQDYDLNIACDRVRRVASLIKERIGTEIFKEIVITVGNDLFNEDGGDGNTTSGTPQDSDTRFPKVYSVACKLFPEIIDMLRPHAQSVRIVLVPGNHDKEMSFVFAMHLQAWYRNCPDVCVDAEARVRKYILFGQCLIALGHFVKDGKNVGYLIPSEAPAMWGITRHREAHGAHLHRESVIEEGMVVFRRAPSLVSPDEWHAEMGYIHTQRHACYVYHPVHGMVEAWYQTV